MIIHAIILVLYLLLDNKIFVGFCMALLWYPTMYLTVHFDVSSIGLYDTVFDVDHDKERSQAKGLEPNGFNFGGADAAGIDYALNR